MLEKGMYDSWKTRICLYIKRKENGEMLINSIEKGPFQLKKEITVPSIDGAPDQIREQTVEDLSPKEKLRYDCDIKAVNILLIRCSQRSQYTPLPTEYYLSQPYQPNTPLPQQQIIHSLLQQSYEPPVVPQQSHAPLTQLDSGFVIPYFLPTDDLIATSEIVAKQCTTKKRVKDSEWFKEKMLLAHAQEAVVVLHEDQQDFLADRLEERKTVMIFSYTQHTVGPTYDSDILSEVPHYDTYHETDVLNSDVQETKYSEHFVSYNDSYDELTSDNNVISYADYTVTTENDVA
ncbi:hypothetical protein Tco_0605337 [Tanacetum coccineum]